MSKQLWKDEGRHFSCGNLSVHGDPSSFYLYNINEEKYELRSTYWSNGNSKTWYKLKNLHAERNKEGFVEFFNEVFDKLNKE